MTRPTSLVLSRSCGGKDGVEAMPSKKLNDGTYKDIARPLKNETRRMLKETMPTGRHASKPEY
jgi:DNA-binding cell septation regulator SpoVG